MSSTRKTLIIVIVISLVAVAGYGFMFYFINGQREAASSFREELAYEVDQEERVRSLERLFDDVADDIETIDNQFLVNDENVVVEYITAIESLAQYAPVTLDVNSVSVPEGPSDIGSLRMQISVTGSQSAVMEVIRMIESFPSVTTIDAIGIGITFDEISGAAQWNTQFTTHALVNS